MSTSSPDSATPPGRGRRDPRQRSAPRRPRPPSAGAARPSSGSRRTRRLPIEVRRFGVGHRRPEGPPGTRGLTGQVIHSDGRGLISELAFSRGGSIAPHANPNTTWFVVIEGGGWVLVGEERRRVAAGEAVLWPANVIHGAWTDHGEMRAFVVEFSGEDDSLIPASLGAGARQLAPGEAGAVARGEGRLAERRPVLDPNRDSEGEPA